MYLKSIEVQGFKSFANKITFEFHNGITGIVGPNGSGKSNVADAVRWVLGEQRIKQLRGASMQDVIFAGSELRKPQGFAYVAITLDNSDHQLAIDYEEVTVSRRLYRSGESEYRINGSACRLKDINELFYDTGIGKEGYSIIGQGQIDKILSGKPEDRRELFDEAAGIVKFKRRKLIAQKKLEDEKQNLVRVGDILAELEKQVGPLARQSEAARKYLSLKEQLKTYDVNLFLLESQGIREQLGEVEKRERIVSQDMEEAACQLEEKKDSYDQLEKDLRVMEERITKKRGLLSQAEMEKGSLEGQINVLGEQINTERMNADHINARRKAILQECQDKQQQIKEYEESSAGIRREAAESSKILQEAEERLQKKDEQIMLLDQKIEEGKGSMINGLNEKASLGARQQRYEAMLEQVQVRRSEVCQRLLRHKSDESAQEELLAEELKKLAISGERTKELLKKQEEWEGEIDRCEQEVRRLTRGLNQKQQEYQTASTRLESLRNLAERYEGYGNSIRRVMEVRDRVHGIRGVVADLITTDQQYETAIETALGGSIQNVVTDSEQTAKQLIEYLKKNKYGRVTFLPLTSIGQRGGFSQPEVLKEPGVIGLASDLVHVKPEYKVLATYLLGRVVVASTIDHAIAVAKKYHYSLRIVTLEGELLSAGGSMTGGAFKNSSNLLGRKRELEELEAVCKKALSLAGRIQDELTMNEGILTEKREELEQFRREHHQESLNQNTLQSNVNRLEDKKEEIQESSRDLILENSQLEEQLQEIEKNRQEITQDTDRLIARNEQLNQDVKQLTLQMETEKQMRERLAHELESIRLKAAGLKQQVDFVTENIHRVQEEMRRLEEELEKLETNTGDSDRVIEDKRCQIQALQEQIVKAVERRECLEEEIQKLSTCKEEKNKEQKDMFRIREELTERISRLDKDLFRLQSQKEKLEEKLEGHVNYMWSEYELTFTAAEPLRNPELTAIPEIRGKIEELKNGIRALGNVNVNAIEDYKEISERYEFMKTQHDDLVEAEQTLLQIIEELDTGMRRQFEEKFKEIRLEFDRVFKELFGGGHGTLELIEGEDILEAGIQIIAQPPGKKLQNMMQLSGGEKALTAISLLFAIQNLKPSPFCLLDEIEAALDDSNVDRFAGYLHKLIKNTQFIVITHRRGTMVASDRLYGITMQEKGVSTLVSVNLIEDQLDA
ncbi:MAG: chromosome segregation protein SMC [Lachnospiraceae bacterium]|nr:chromosome segregation protein SMC [Lachnospiraceae bacterium]